MATMAVRMTAGVLLAAVACAGMAPFKQDAGLRDAPIVGDTLEYLDGTWTASATVNGATVSIPASVPGDLITDLQNDGLVGDPNYELNWLNSSLWNDNVWTYSTTFDVAAGPGSEVLLVFDGIKMGANISVNGRMVQYAADQFLRYVLDIGQAGVLRNGANTLSVAFDSSMHNGGRFMSCSGGWDWAPYSNTNIDGAHTFSKGIWKSVYVVTTSSATITHVAPHVFYNGSYPVGALQEDEHGDFEVQARVFMWAPKATSGTLAVTGHFATPVTAQASVSLTAGESVTVLKLKATAADIDLWWPIGMGKQPLYNVSVTFTPAAPIPTANPLSASRRIGFRFFALVTGNDTDPAYVNASTGADGTGSLGMLFRVNGAPVFSRGANMIPMEEMEGRLNSEAFRQLVYNAAGGNMNTLRVWGGGIFLPNVWYDTCDELGILVYHDMQYAQQGHSPIKNDKQDAELRHQVRRLSHHTSIVIWDGCNECHVVIGTPTGIYATFVMTVVAEEDKSRTIWPSCPAAGWKHGVYRLTSQPNGNPLGLVPTFSHPAREVVPAAAAAVLPRAPAPLRAGSNCTFQANVDYDEGTLWKQQTAHSEDECCAACMAMAECNLAVLFGDTCYLKNDAHPTPKFKEGVMACWPKGHGPIPPPPPPTPPPPPSPGRIETHGPYQHGGGFPAVNGNSGASMFSPNIPITIANVATGPQYPNVFASEFGCVVMSSFESMSPTLDPKHWSLHGNAPPDHCSGTKCTGGNVMAQRNYPCDNIVQVYFGPQNLNATGPEAFKKQLYQCMLGQALEMKSNIETRRSTNQFGIIIWQLNEIWPTGGWGSIEYGTPSPGQVIGGRWKPLHYFLAKSTFADVLVACGGNGACYVKNDGITPFKGTASVTATSLATGATQTLKTLPVDLAAGAGVSQGFQVDVSAVSGATQFLTATATASGASEPSSENTILLLPPSQLKLADADVKFQVAAEINAAGNADITVTTDKPAMFVTLTTLAQGRFSDNAFALSGASKAIEFLFFGPPDLDTLKASLRLEHLAQYM